MSDIDRPERKPARLKNYDYNAPGAYFVTICTREKRCILSSVVQPNSGDVGAVPALVSYMKRRTNRLSASSLWQRSFYDHIVRNEDEYREIWQYIDGNPLRRAEDRFYIPL